MKLEDLRARMRKQEQPKPERTRRLNKHGRATFERPSLLEVECVLCGLPMAFEQGGELVSSLHVCKACDAKTRVPK